MMQNTRVCTIFPPCSSHRHRDRPPSVPWWTEPIKYITPTQSVFWIMYHLFRFGLCCDTWSQWGHSVSCMTIHFPNLQITRLDITPHIKWAVSLVIEYGHLNLNIWSVSEKEMLFIWFKHILFHTTLTMDWASRTIQFHFMTCLSHTDKKRAMI